MIDTNIVF